ncbi:MAG: HlyC/CorC family transporter [Erysipelotrichaceae bacterium]|nr:HlyC/CorC family transporter [Erysipelotrichaceae bacterium]
MESNDDADADADSILLQIIIIAVLTIINAFFAMSEMAVISANKTKIDILAKDGNKKAKLVQKLNDNQTNFLSTIQVGITLAGFFSSATAAGSIAVLLSDWLITLNVPYAEGIAVVVITLLLSFLTLIFGELLPKKIALAFPEKISMQVAGAINFVRVLATPIVKLLSGTCNLITKLIGINKYLVEDKVSEEEIISVVEESVEDGTLDVEKQKMIESVLKFNDLTATDIMTPRIKVFMIDIEEPLNEYLNDIFEQKFTRIPVYKETRDNIIGWIHVRDLMQEIIEKGVENVKIDKVMRKALYVRDMMKINKLFQVMKDTKNQIAILLDEFGGVSGIATMEDIVEEVVGNIYDEYDDEKNFIRLNDNQYLVNGDTPIQEVNRDLDLEFDEENSNYDTIGGLILATLDSFPKGGEVLEFDNIELSVQKVKNQKIETIKITINEKVIEDLEEIE